MAKTVEKKSTKVVKKGVQKRTLAAVKTPVHPMAKAVNLIEVHRKYDLPLNQYGAILEKAMLEKGTSIKDLSNELLCSYEHVRQIVHGGRSVSAMMNRAICTFFGLDEAEMERVYKSDQMISQYGDVMKLDRPKDAVLQAIENGWPLLTEKQKELLAENVARFTFQNRSHGTFKAVN